MKRFLVLFYLLLTATPAWANSTLQNLAANTALDLGPYVCTDVAGETGNCRRVTDFAGATYDPVTKKLYVFGGGHASTNYNGLNSFNTETTTWTELYPPTSTCTDLTTSNWNSAQGSLNSGTGLYPRPLARHTLESMHVINGEFILTSPVEGNYPACSLTGGGDPTHILDSLNAKAAHYNFASGTWSWSATATDGGNVFPANAYDPVSGNIVIIGTPWFDLYNPATKVRTRQIDLTSTNWLKTEGGSNLSNGDFGYNNSMVYYPPTDKFYYMARGYGVIEITPNRSNWALSTATKLNTTGTQSPGNALAGSNVSGYAYDTVAQIIGTIAGGKFYAFNPKTKAFSNQTISGFSGDVGWWAIDYDTFNNVWLFISEWTVASQRTYAYKYQASSGGDTTAPSVSITAPSAGATVSGASVTLTATASDNVGVAGVQFKMDGANIGVEDTVSPYSITWNSTTASNGSHSITAVARDAAGNGTTSSAVGVTVSNAGGGADFTTRCAAAGVLRCVGFDTSAVIANTLFGGNSGIDVAGNSIPVIDTAQKASGAGSIKFTIPANSQANSSGAYWINFSDDLLTQFGQNSEFYIQFRQRFSSCMLYQGSAEPCTGPPRAYASANGWKQSIIGTGDKPGCTTSVATNCYSSCSSLETVSQNTYQHGFAQMYNSCSGSASHGAFDPFNEPFGGTDFKLQNNRPSPYCLYSAANAGTQFPPTGNCFSYVPNEWMTFKIHITTGPWVNGEWSNSHVDLWIGREGQPLEKVLNWGPYNLTAGSSSTDQKFGKVWLLPYNTGKSSAETNPVAYTWYDELIVSTQDIADPSTGTAPQVFVPVNFKIQ